MKDACIILTGAISVWLYVAVMTMGKHGEIELPFLILVIMSMPEILNGLHQLILTWLWYKILKQNESLPFTICFLKVRPSFLYLEKLHKLMSKSEIRSIKSCINKEILDAILSVKTEKFLILKIEKPIIVL